MKRPLQKLPLTILILTHRNDKRFQDSLKSAQIADQVMIIDNQSQNDWSALQKKYDFTVVPWPDKITDFAQVRNQALQHARHQWVLFLDSDEILPEHAYLHIAEVVRKNLYHGVLVKRIDFFLGKALRFGEPGRTRLLRLAKAQKLSFTGAVHETANIPGTVGDSPIEIWHYSHETVADFIATVTLYAQLAAAEKDPPKWQTLIELLLYPPGKYILNYLLRLGFLDGWRGLVYAVVMSLHSLFVRVFRLESRKGYS